MLDAPPPAIHIQAVSNRADLISDGQALVAITLPKGARHVRVRLGHRDLTRALGHRSGRRWEGIVSGLRVGPNRLVATARRARGARLTITNHPNGGPATTTTDQGREVPFVVRQELGYADRDQYKFLTLFTPGEAWSRWRPQPQWNHKLLVTGGGGCGAAYGAGEAPLDDLSGTVPKNPAVQSSYIAALGRGFAVMSTALDNTGHNCSLATEAESLIMAKERLIENYGDVRYTIGTGCSGGSIVQQTVANAYPGAVYDGLVITCAYPDVLTAGAQFADYHLLRRYLEGPSHALLWPPPAWGLVYGRPDPVNAIVADEALFKSATNPVGDCVPKEKAYDPKANPGGARCSILDAMINMLGPRPRGVWSDMERRAGRGFAGQPFGNAGIQYGLDALNQGLITAEQFVDLNATVGGGDVDLNPTPGRIAGDDGAVANAYRTGAINEMTHISGVAIIDHAGPDPGVAHDYAHTWWIRDRLDRAQGNHDNEVLWFGPAPLIGDTSWPTEALLAMDRWLAAVEKDPSNAPRAKKIVADRPADIQDRCTADFCTSTAATRYGTPRQVAGGDELNDIAKCRLKPLVRSDYKAAFTDAQWAELQTTFPDGVCDWTRPGIGRQRNLAWLTYQDARGRVIYGGRPMGPPPRSVAHR